MSAGNAGRRPGPPMVSISTVKGKDVEAVVSRTVSQEVPPPGGLSRPLKLGLWVAVVVLVAAAATAIAVGVMGATGSSSSGGSSRSSGSSGSGQATPGTPAEVAPQPAAPGAPPAAVPSADTPVPPAEVLPPAGKPVNFSTTQPTFFVPNGFKPLWWDEFDSLDSGMWLLQAGAPSEPSEGLQVFTASPGNVEVADGNLTITALKEGNGYTSARLDSKISGSWHPGMKLPDGSKIKSVHVAARLRVPQGGTGLLAALTLRPVQNKYGPWPASGEVNILGAINDMKKVKQGIQFGGPYPANEKRDVETQQPSGQPYSNDFHLFALDWERDSFTLKVDGEKTGSFEEWWTSASGATQPAPFDQPFSIVMYLAVGGTWPGPPGPTTPASASMAVDYVRVFAKLEDEGGKVEQ